ncbi:MULTISPECIES: acetolactate synthase large subunit [unclassified Mycolicibacterium]|uniref:acetolactate synthase large subunit n=1 Tax=unclassified Mycolicibacterium TaxID=2636767 RepID=UPI0012DC969A|nr:MULTISPECIES: acetolactate synthase large subunit [unclassified Mycolicibacterium]MUL83741.1 acetolactate synthase large subunit [Mycolicibacterium sp. CBMA 329]MUL90732.1 acetolactate synthase large subunit [Mycolicibacterium sp. CBMA 331]MUM00700.1 acetolactate synthase large subunit [Mycolicibacterium sp. CBMA 334]MUM29771.1 acetolactate synthase large subunit [Mycolicibacterium sp. CBMA 295]MUM41676.1 acetolactate synthase large subunit [Mycolicibacterium sp. CBMA 247]
MSTGAEVVVNRLLAEGVGVCFANPGTSEMHFVAALDTAPAMRPVLCLFEGVATGAADGYARIAGRPAATLLHLGPGMANGLANLHNARRAFSPVVNVVGDHATYHQPLDAPLESDIDALGHWVHGSVHRPESAADLDATVHSAVQSATGVPGRVATVILPADYSWGSAPQNPLPGKVSDQKSGADGDMDVAAAAELLRTQGERAVLLIGGAATGVDGLQAAARIRAATGARALVETFPARLARGQGVPAIERLGYLAEQATQQLSGATHLVLVGAKSPVSFFAYPGKPSVLVPDGAEVSALAIDDLSSLADELGGAVSSAPQPSPAELPTGTLNPQNLAQVIAALLPENAIISDEANTSGVFLPAATASAPRHDVLTLTGGAIGQGLPVAVGAAIAAPHRPVIALQSDGSAAYTISALWTMAREQLDVTVVILNNHAYAILQLELLRVGTQTTGERSRSLLDLSRPDIDFASIAQGFGVPATRATTAEELATQFRTALAEPGPHLIDAALPAWSPQG